MAKRAGQVVEILFDADQWLSSADWAAPALEASHPNPAPLSISRPFVRRCSTSSTISCASSIQLSPTLPSSSTFRFGNTARNTSSRPTTFSLPCPPGLHATSLFLSCVAGASKVVQRARDPAITQGKLPELKLSKKLTFKTDVQKLNKKILKTEPGTQAGVFKGIMRRFR